MTLGRLGRHYVNGSRLQNKQRGTEALPLPFSSQLLCDEWDCKHVPVIILSTPFNDFTFKLFILIIIFSTMSLHVRDEKQ